MNQTDVKARARKIIETAVNAVLTTLDPEGFPHPRTMWTPGMDDDFTVYFITGRSLQKIKQIEANPKVCMFWTLTENDKIGWSYAALKGIASVTDDQRLRDRFWNDMLKEYFPGGRTDPEYVVIVVKPKELLLMDSHKYPLDRVEF
jgi:general stress protein 26